MVPWMLQSLAVAGLLAALVHVACRVGRIGPVGRHALWLLVLVKLLTPPVVVLHWPWVIPAPRLTDVTSRFGSEARAPDVVVPRAAQGEALRPTAVETPPLTPRSMSTTAVAGRVGGVLVSHALDIWLVGGLVFAWVQGVRVRRVLRSVRAAGMPDLVLSDHVEKLTRRLRVGAVRIRVVSGITSPLIWCVNPRRPQLLWPAVLPEEISEDCRRGLIAHELAHVKRRDHWVGWLELAAGCLWWWNPVFWYVRSRLRENAELACDAWVIDALPHGRRTYAEALLAVCAVPTPNPRTAPIPAVGVSTGSRRFLERRLAMIMRERVPLHLPRVGLFSLALIFLATLPAWARGTPSAPPQDRRATTPIAAVPIEVAPEAPQVTILTPSRGLPITATMRGQALPADAQALVDRFSEQQAEARREADAKIATQREELVKQLQALQDSYTKAGSLDDAVAVRNGIRQLTSGAGRRMTPDVVRLVPISPSAPDSAAWAALRNDSFGLTAYRDRVGETLAITVTGSTQGRVWGDGVYTDDSSLGTAAVHAGLLRPGETGTVRVTILPGEDRYTGSTRYGVTSADYGAWDGSYRLDGAANSSTSSGSSSDSSRSAPRDLGLYVSADRSSISRYLQSLRGEIGSSFTMEVEGSVSSSVWGTDVYTDDSSIAAAAVHAGILRVGERGLVKVTIVAGQDSYTGSDRHGVKSEAWQRWDGSFRIERAPRR
jgi:beta-lactamase regulating signal transducer with metallopeptidase domain